MYKRRNILLVIAGILLVAIILAILSVSDSIGENVPPTNLLPTAERHAGATAQCKDGTFTYSTNHRGACSDHKGVQIWL